MATDRLTLFGRLTRFYALRWADTGQLFVYSSQKSQVRPDDPLVLSGEAEYYEFEVWRMTDTLTLFDRDMFETALAAAITPATIEDQFRAFDEANPHVYHALVDLARGLVQRGHHRIGIGMLFEVLRWQTAMTTTDTAFKLNNNYRSHYARLIMLLEEDLAGVFETRELRGDQ